MNKLIVESRRIFLNKSDCNWARTQDHIFCKLTLKHLAELMMMINCFSGMVEQRRKKMDYFQEFSPSKLSKTPKWESTPDPWNSNLQCSHSIAAPNYLATTVLQSQIIELYHEYVSVWCINSGFFITSASGVNLHSATT